MKISHRIAGNENGMVLPIALMFLTIIALLGGTAVMVTTTELKIGANHKTAELAFHAAEAGLAEARARLRFPSSDPNHIGDPVSGYDSMWSAYILTSGTWQTSNDPYYDGNLRNYIPTTASQTNTSIQTNSLQSTILYFVRVRHKREFDAEQVGHTTTSAHYYDGDGNTESHSASSPGNIIYYGYGNPASPTIPTQFTTSGSTVHKPVEIITAYGICGTGVQIIETEIARPPSPPISAPLYANGNVTGNGSALTISGDDYCGSGTSLPPIYTLSPATTTLNGSPVLTGTPVVPVSGSNPVDIPAYLDSLKGAAGVTITADQTGVNYGDAGNHTICYSSTSDPPNVGGLKLQNVTGFGVLLVEGDLVLGGGFSWSGLVVCTGLMTFNGGGDGVNIQGAVLSNQTLAMNGGLDIQYDSCLINTATNTQPHKILRWRQIY